jgi:hypothetical protein
VSPASAAPFKHDVRWQRSCWPSSPRTRACGTTAHAAPMTVEDLPATLQRLPQNAEQLATEPGCEGTANAGVDEVERQGGHGVPASWRPTRRPAAPATDRCWTEDALPYVAAELRTVPASRPSNADCCPFAARGVPRLPTRPTRPTRERLACSWLTRPPVILGFALCLPLTEREPLSLRGSRVAVHDRTRVGGRQRARAPACGRCWGQVGQGC